PADFYLLEVDTNLVGTDTYDRKTRKTYKLTSPITPFRAMVWNIVSEHIQTKVKEWWQKELETNSKELCDQMVNGDFNRLAGAIAAQMQAVQEYEIRKDILNRVGTMILESVSHVNFEMRYQVEQALKQMR